MITELQGLTDSYKQHISVPLQSDGTTVDFYFEYRPQQRAWFFDVVYDALSWSSYGNRLVKHPNILRQHTNFIPFGLYVYTDVERDPIQLTDLSDGTCSLAVIEGDSIPYVESTYFQK